METFRRIWPSVPFLVLIRDPVEVMVSCLAAPPGWMRMQSQPDRAARRYGWPHGEIEAMPAEQFCARALAAMLTAARPMLGNRCRVLDYTQIDRDHLPGIAEFLGVGMGEFDLVDLDRAFASYSKDRRGSRVFSADSLGKQTAASPALRAAAERWAMPLYQQLRAEAKW